MAFQPFESSFTAFNNILKEYLLEQGPDPVLSYIQRSQCLHQVNPGALAQLSAEPVLGGTKPTQYNGPPYFNYY